MNPRTTGMLALAAILLGGFIYFYEIEGESSRQAAIDEELRIYPGLDAGAVNVIEFSTLDGFETRFERVGGRWRLSVPVPDLADSVALDAIADALSQLARKGSISGASASGPSAGEEYGLGVDARTIRFMAEGESHGLRIGRSTPVGGHLYVGRLATEASVHGIFETLRGDIAYVEGFQLNALNRNLADLRERRVLNFEGADLRTLRITWPDPSGGFGEADVSVAEEVREQVQVEVALARNAAGEWLMGAPMSGPADPQTLRDLISNLSFLRATTFVDERSDEAAIALANPSITFHWTLPGDHIEKRMRIGGPFRDGLLAEGPQGRRVIIAPGRLDDFKRRVVDYRFKSISRFDLVEARHLSIEFSGDREAGGAETSLHVEADLEAAGWSGREPAIDSDAASELIRTLSSLRATDILAEEMGDRELASLGLSPPRVRIRVQSETDSKGDADLLVDLRVGRLVSGRGLLAQRADAPTIYVLAESVTRQIPISAAAFANRFEKAIPESADKGVELDPEDLAVDPLEGIEMP